MITIEREFRRSHLVQEEALSGMTFTGEDGGHKFLVHVKSPAGEAETLTGSVVGKFVRADGVTVELTAAEDYAGIENGAAWVILAANCYTQAGPFRLTVTNIEQGGTRNTICAFTGYVRTSETDSIVDPENVINVDAIAGMIEDMQDATEAAQEAASFVNSIIAPSYSTSVVYAVGDYCTYSGAMYRCTAETDGAFNPNHWQAVKVGSEFQNVDAEIDDLKSALDYAVNAVDNRVSNDELYNGYQNKVPTFEHGYVNTSGEYTDETQRYITGGLPTAENTKVVNHSAKSVFVVYFSAFTDFSDFTYGTYVTVASGGELTLATQYPYFAVQGTNNTLDISEFRGVYIVGTSELEYLSYANLHDVPEMRESLEDLEKFQKDVEPTEIKIGKYTNTAVGHSVAIYDSAFFALGIFDAKPNTKYSIQTQGRTASTKYVMFADSNNIVLEWHEYTVTTTGEIITDDVVSPPTAAKLYIDATDNRSGSSASQYIKVKESLLPETTEKSIISDEQMRFIASAQRRFTTTPADNYADNRLPTFVHVTDIHGDSERFANAVDLADLIHADAVLNTGDSVAYNPTDSVAFLADKMADATVPMLPLIGNHESYTLTEQQMYTNFIQPFSTGLVLDSSVDYSTYYYRDFATHKIRVIGINQFQYRGVSNMTTQRNYHQAQITFLCNALLNAPDGYGIIIMLHTPEAGTTKSAGYTKFYQDEILYNNTGASIKPIYEIVDAYISGTAINKTFDNISGNSPATFTVNANFSGKNNSEFIAYVSGHAHRDSVYYLTDVTNKQLMLNAVCTNSWTHRNSNGTPGSNYPYYCELTDLPRVIGTDTENAVNVYTIDRINKTVRIVRYGSDTPYNFSERRDYMVIPYAD